MSTISTPDSSERSSGVNGIRTQPVSRDHAHLRIILLFATFGLPIVFMSGKSLTGDEAAHLPAGYSYLTTHKVTLNPEHPPLIKELCALPLLFLDLTMPIDQDSIERSAKDSLYEWRFGHRFFAQPHRDQLLFWGRIPAVLLSLALAVLILRWATELWGPRAGSVALFLYAFDPTITAHAQLVTTDVGFALFATSFLYVLRRYLRAPSAGRLLAAGVTLGLALGAKFSGLMLIPLAAFLLGGAAWFDAPSDGYEGEGAPRREIACPPRPRARRLLSACGAFGALLLVAYPVLWLVYFAPTDPLFYWKGLRTVQSDTAVDYPTLLMGEIRPGGFSAYFLVAWLVKTPLPSLLLLAIALVLFLRGKGVGWLDEAFIAVPPLVFFFGYSMRAGQIGVRYLIPCFPFLFIFAARAATATSRALTAAVAALLAWYVVEFAAISPDHLSYFNEIAGGSRQGTYWLDDSNVDWGQGFIELGRFLRSHRIERYFLCSFPPNLDPKSYGIDGTPLWIDALLSPPPGTLVLSAHCVARARALMAQEHGDGAGNWLAHATPQAIVGHAYYVYELRP
jgi:hypothetical protein